jgi:uncharacterized protein (TIGR03083 family)
MSDVLESLRYSVDQLSSIIEPLSPEQLRTPAYPSEWTVADVLSHLGSGAVIFVRTVESAVSGEPAPSDFNRSVWDEWDAKSPDAQAADLPAVDEAVVASLSKLSPEERAGFKVALGPFEMDFAAYAGLRLGEHALHTWDVEVTFDSDAVLPREVVDAILDGLLLLARFAAKPTGSTRTLVVQTDAPQMTYQIELAPESVTLSEGANDANVDVRMPAEAFIRLVYGRLDAAHTPAGITGTEHLDELRKVFPGF